MLSHRTGLWFAYVPGSCARILRVSTLAENALSSFRHLSILLSLSLASTLAYAPCPAQQSTSPTQGSHTQPTSDAYLKLAAEVDQALRRDVLGMWFPRSIDREHGGFHSHFTRDWHWAPSDGKFSVFQGRMTWVAAQVVLREPTLKAQLQAAVATAQIAGAERAGSSSVPEPAMVGLLAISAAGLLSRRARLARYQ